MQTNKDLYKLLGLPREASQDDVQQAHRKLVREYHPDANPEDPRAEGRFKEVQQAYEVLSDEKKRREYDEGLRTSSRGSPGRPRSRESSRESSSRPRTRAAGREYKDEHESEFWGGPVRQVLGCGRGYVRQRPVWGRQ